MRLAASIIAATVTAAGAASAQDASERTSAVIRGADYCVSVIEAGMAGQAPVLTGPEGFREDRLPYGQLRWLFGQSDTAPALVGVVPGTETCAVMAVAGEPVDNALRTLFEGKDGFVADDRVSAGYRRAVDGGWIRVGWTVAELEHEGQGPVWVMVSSMKDSD